jgi:hypothetical protein
MNSRSWFTVDLVLEVNVMSDRCLSGLALGQYYRELALDLSRDLARTLPDFPLLLLTDGPETFAGAENVIPIRHRHHFGYRPYNDKVFAIEEALKRFSIVVQIDIDTRIVGDIREPLARDWLPGLTARTENLLEHTERYNPGDLSGLNTLAGKLGIDLARSRWVGEAMFVVREDRGREKAFVQTWKKLARYWDIHRLSAKDGTLIGLSAASVGWDIADSHRRDLDECLDHFDAHKRTVDTNYGLFKKKWDYRSRIWRTKLSSLLQPDLLP